MTRIAEAVYRKLAGGEAVVLAKITSQHGSTPRNTGTQMVISGDGKHVGTIGGGLLEAKVTVQCMELLSGGPARIVRFDMGHADVASMDMICGGDLEVLLDPLAPTAELVALFDRWRRMETNAQAGVFVIAMRRSDAAIGQIHHALIQNNGLVQGTLPLTPGAVETLVQAGHEAKAMQTMVIEEHHVIVEPIHKPKTVFILGAGHVAQPTAHMAALMGYRVVVLDDRDTFANAERFPDAETVAVLPDFERPFDGFKVDRDSFIVIVTRGHLYDKVVLAQALRTDAGYIGMIGSRRKRDHIFHRLKSEGFDEEDLLRVHSPIGLNIGAETPEEIALSIVAEMIKTKNGLRC